VTASVSPAAAVGTAVASVVLPAGDLDATLAYFVDQLGFRLLSVSPADAPRVATIEGHGLRVQLDRDAGGAPGHLRLPIDGPGIVPTTDEMMAPNGTAVELVLDDEPLEIPPLQPSLVVTTADGPEGWVTGRAGMRYRDLLPDRLGGRFIASHIAIPDGGPVPDYVHHHRIRFQLIFCHRGWVRVVYEDQGPPFVLRPGDCVLQPPGIRHRVLEASPGLHVVELSCPAEHVTLLDHELTLPTSDVRPERDFGGQRFVHHEATVATWQPAWLPGFDARETGIAAATDGLAGVRVLRPAPSPASRPHASVIHDGELLFFFVLQGGMSLRLEASSDDRTDAAVRVLQEADAVAIPAGLAFELVDPTYELELLEVSLPAESVAVRPIDERR
jgi:mannose-6-phosphate isomerase-like protein (cupin superfamily)